MVFLFSTVLPRWCLKIWLSFLRSEDMCWNTCAPSGGLRGVETDGYPTAFFYFNTIWACRGFFQNSGYPRQGRWTPKQAVVLSCPTDFGFYLGEVLVLGHPGLEVLGFHNQLDWDQNTFWGILQKPYHPKMSIFMRKTLQRYVLYVRYEWHVWYVWIVCILCTTSSQTIPTSCSLKKVA